MIPLFKVLINESASDRVKSVLESGYTGQGAVCEEFETEFQKLVQADSKPLLMNSCTSALDLAYHLIGVDGGEVITTAQTCLATNQSLLHRNCKIIWADVDPISGCIDPDDVARKVTKNTKAIIGVDWGGRSCDWDKLKSHGIPVVQDAAHSILTYYKGKPIAQAGGDFVAWSFQSIKTLSMGDGGALLVPESLYKEAKLLRWFYLDRDGSESFRCAQNTKKAGFKYQSNDILAAVGVENMKLTKWAAAAHKTNACFLHYGLSGVKGVQMPMYDTGCSYWVFTILVDDRDGFIARMKEQGVACSEVHRRNDIHDAFKEFRADLPNLDYFSARQVNIPCGWWLSQIELVHIIESVKKCVG